ncbi:hypothetical protein ACFL0T_01740 [Candidatus Omnitrophota bacterium]
MRSKRLLAGIGVLSAALFLTSSCAIADIALAPLTRTIQLAQEESKEVIYKVANRSDQPIALDISARTWFTLPENSQIDIKDWLNLDTAALNLKPDEERDISFTVTVPKDAKGELASMIYFAPKRQEGQMIGTSYGVSLYIFIKGTEIVDPQIGDATIARNDNKTYVTVTINNKGNVHFRPVVKATVKVGDTFEEKIDLPFGKPIFGGQNFTFVKELDKELPEKGECIIEASCNYGNDEASLVEKVFTITLDSVKE